MKPVISYRFNTATLNPALFAFLFSFHSSLLVADDAQTAEVDSFWAKISKSVSKGDFEAYRSAHHPDAVLVVNGKSQSMEGAHKAFQRGFNDTAAGTVKAGIEFRWTQRSVGVDTAFQKGVFRYWSEASGNSYTEYTQFEAILVKGDKGWKLLVQKQYKALTEEDWDAITDGEIEE
ncbi:MAG: nuclear transport factor 2 family protein [Verrucomicrobiota bacterium]